MLFGCLVRQGCSIAIASRVEELDPVHVDEIFVILASGFLVVPGLSALAPIQVDPKSSVKVLPDDFRSPPEGLHGKPFCALREFAILVLPPLAAGNRELGNDAP